MSDYLNLLLTNESIGVYINDLTLNATKATTIEKPPAPTYSAATANRSNLLTPDQTKALPATPGHAPSTSTSGPQQQVEPLVNFERYQSAASIVKTVLRLVDASKMYDYDVAPALLSRCLWMCALGDEEIRARSRALAM